VAVLLLTSRIVFFADQNLSGDAIPQALIDSTGYPCQKHKDNFALDAHDVDWLPQIGRRGWILVAKDWRMLQRPIERQAILASNVRAFIFRERSLKGQIMAEIIKVAAPHMIRAIDRFQAPFVFSLETNGHITALSSLTDIVD
jgi:PIN domain-containing protein